MSKNLQFYGQFDYKLDNYLYDNFFKDKMNGISIEAGASDGVTENTTKFFEETLNWKTYNVEPLPIWFEKLIVNRPNSININRALHPTAHDLEVEFNVPDLYYYGVVNHLGSLNKENLEKYNVDVVTINVKTTTYNKIIEENNIHELDLFVLDIEGYEIEFLKTFNNWKIYPTVLVIEVGHLDSDIITNIVSKKYKLYDRQYVNNIYVII